MAKITKEDAAAFLKDLSELTRKHGFVIGGCGCCGSPYVHHLTRPGELTDLEYDRESGAYRFGEGLLAGRQEEEE